MPTIVLPQQESSGEKWARAGVGIGQSLQGIADLMFVLEQRKEQQKKNELVEAVGALKLFGDDPNAAPVGVQQKLIDAFGIEGVAKDPVTGNYMFPRSAQARLADKQLAFKDKIYSGALAGDPTSLRDARVAEGLEQAPPSPEEIDLKEKELANSLTVAGLRKSAAYISANGRFIAAQQKGYQDRLTAGFQGIVDIEKERAKAALQFDNRESPYWGVEGTDAMFENEDAASAFAGTVGTSNEAVRLLLWGEAKARLAVQAQRVDTKHAEVMTDKLNEEFRQLAKFAPAKELMGMVEKAYKTGSKNQAQILSRGFASLLLKSYVDIGGDLDVLDDPKMFWPDPSNAKVVASLGGTEFLQHMREAAKEFPDDEPEVDEGLAGDAVGMANGQVFYPAGSEPAPPSVPIKKENPVSMLKEPIKEQFRVAIANGMSGQDARTQMLIQAQQVLPGTSMEALRAMVDASLEEVLSEATRGVK